jgi:hypothetical protein
LIRALRRIRSCSSLESLSNSAARNNHHRPHTGIGGHPPISRLTNLSGQYI